MEILEKEFICDVGSPSFGFVSAAFQKGVARRLLGQCKHSWAVCAWTNVIHEDYNYCLSSGVEVSYRCAWKPGDVVGFACDLDAMRIHVSVNGDFTAPNGCVFDLDSDAVGAGLFAACSFSGQSQLKVGYNLGETSFRFAPPSFGFQGFVRFTAPKIGVMGVCVSDVRSIPIKRRVREESREPKVGMKVKATSATLGAPKGRPTLLFSVGKELKITKLQEERGEWYAVGHEYDTLWFPLSSTDWKSHQDSQATSPDTGAVSESAGPTDTDSAMVDVVTNKRKLDFNDMDAGGGKKRRVGGGAAASDADKAVIESDVVLEQYDRWVKTCMTHAFSEKSDEAMGRLKNALAKDAGMNSVLRIKSCVLSGGSRGIKSAHGAVQDLQEAFEAAESAVASERKHQLEDALGFFPSTSLIRAGQRLLAPLQDKLAVMKRVVQVYETLEANLKDAEECVDKSGAQSKRKDQLVQDIKSAREQYDDRLEALESLAPLLKRGGNEVKVKNRASDYPWLQGGLPSLKDLRHHVQESYLGMQDATLKLTGEVQQKFPEVTFFVGRGLPSELAGLWRPSLKLDVFDKIEKVQTQANHTVWRVWKQNESFAIKEYNSSQPDHLKTCLKEAAIIYQQRHPAIVEIQALFQGTETENDTFYLQMPWYEHGSLDKWVSGTQVPDWSKVRNVLLDAVIGLGHLHSNRIIHGDIKPANILVDSRERGRLGDFDISIDTKQRTSAAHTALIMAKTARTMYATALGMTEDFAAPELVTDNTATTYTDMFAFGKTVQYVQSSCEPQDPASNTQASGQTAKLISSLTKDDPKCRLSAKHTARSDFFTVLDDVIKKDSRPCCKCPDAEGVKDSNLGIICSEGHFHCKTHVVELVQELLQDENIERFEMQEGKVMCSKFPSQCRSTGFHDRDLALHLPNAVYQSYLKARIELDSRGERRKCNVCLEEKSQGVVCEDEAGHFICSDCAPQSVNTVLDQVEASEQSLQRHRERGGCIKCVQPDCQAHYSEPALARALPDDIFRRYRAAQDDVVEQRLFEELQARFQRDLADLREEFQRGSIAARTKQDEAATAEYMRRQYPNAVQCPQCRAGPVVAEGCYDLSAHNGERTRGGRISNACPSCGFFSRDRNHWHRWDGQMRQALH